MYDVGPQEESTSFLSEHKGILATIGIAVVLILLWLLYERKNGELHNESGLAAIWNVYFIIGFF